MKAEQAILAAPGVLAVNVDYESAQATVGSAKDEPPPIDAIIAELEKIGYVGTLVAD